MESTDSSAGSQQPNLPPGFRFHPTDEELVVHYLKKKATSSPLPVAIIAEVDLYKFDPWELPAKATFGEQEWYFFSPRDRKYPNGARPNRAATSGYWKATGTDKPVLTSGGTQKVGVKKALVFYGGKPPKGIKTNWIMHEYRLAENKVSNRPPGFDLGNKKNSLRLDDWVLCRIYKKNNTGRSSSLIDHEKDDSSSMDDMMMMGHVPSSIMVGGQQSFPHMMMHRQSDTLFDGISNNNGGVGGEGPADMEYSLKRTLSTVNWTADDEVATATATAAMSKRFHHGHDQNQRSAGDGNANDDHYDGGSMVRTCHHGNGNSFAALLSQMPAQTPPLPQPQQGIMGSLGVGDGIFRSPYQLPAGLNWYS